MALGFLGQGQSKSAGGTMEHMASSSGPWVWQDSDGLRMDQVESVRLNPVISPIIWMGPDCLGSRDGSGRS